jgi:predicted SnoaL-like aldol condensation-catalyzing enzyme
MRKRISMTKNSTPTSTNSFANKLDQEELMRMKSAEETKAMVLKAFDTLFNKRDYAKAAEFWSETYIQHSAHIEPGRDGLFNLIRSLPDTLRYENALILAEGDYVMLHGRFSGHGRPRSWIAADILRIEGGRLAEHWDVLQDEVTKEESRSGLPMFGSSFAEPDHKPTAAVAASLLTIDEARRIVAPLYDALNEPGKKDVAALLGKATNPDYKSYSTNEDWLTRDQLADVFKMLGSAVPDLRWTIKDIQTFGDQIVVRGEATGTPIRELFGAKPTGKSFKTMALDLFTVKNGKLASAYHVENWMTALQQISK